MIIVTLKGKNFEEITKYNDKCAALAKEYFEELKKSLKKGEKLTYRVKK